MCCHTQSHTHSILKLELEKGHFRNSEYLLHLVSLSVALHQTDDVTLPAVTCRRRRLDVRSRSRSRSRSVPASGEGSRDLRGSLRLFARAVENRAATAAAPGDAGGGGEGARRRVGEIGRWGGGGGGWPERSESGGGGVGGGGGDGGDGRRKPGAV